MVTLSSFQSSKKFRIYIGDKTNGDLFLSQFYCLPSKGSVYALTCAVWSIWRNHKPLNIWHHHVKESFFFILKQLWISFCKYLLSWFTAGWHDFELLIEICCLSSWNETQRQSFEWFGQPHLMQALIESFNFAEVLGENSSTFPYQTA